MRFSEKEANELLKNIEKNKSQRASSNIEEPSKQTSNIIWPDGIKLVEENKDEIKIVIPVAPITKKNHSNIISYGAKCPVCKRGTYFKLIPSKEYSAYKSKIAPYLSLIRAKVSDIDYPINLKCLFYVKKKYQGDVVGYLQSIQDLLVEAEILKDDNRNIVAGTDGSRVFYDKTNPRTEIIITRMNNYEQWGTANKSKS